MFKLEDEINKLCFGKMKN